MRYIAATTLGAAALILAAAPTFTYAQSTYGQSQTEQQSTSGQQSTTEKIGEKVKSTATEAGEKVKSTATEAGEKVKSTTSEAKGMATDSWVTAKAKIALYADERVKGRQISVETRQGTVILRGKVDSEDAKTAAGERVKAVEHVKGVRNELQVVAPAERKMVDTDDKTIASAVEQRLKKDPQLKKARISARADSGIVTLTGEVKSIGISSRASEVASDVPGVRAVRNDLTYESHTSMRHK
jgi:hyperosmotically inducible protein